MFFWIKFFILTFNLNRRYFNCSFFFFVSNVTIHVCVCVCLCVYKYIYIYIYIYIYMCGGYSWNLPTTLPTLALLVSLEQDGWQVVLRLRHVEAYGIAFLTELFNLSVAGFEIPEIWKNSFIMMEPLQSSVFSLALYNHFVSACLVTDAYMTSYAGDIALLGLTLLPASWMLRQWWTYFVLPWWGRQMVSNWSLLLKNTAFTSDTRQSWLLQQ